MARKQRFNDYVSRLRDTSGSGDLLTRIRITGEAAIRETASSRLATIASDGSSWLRLAQVFTQAAVTGSPVAMVGPSFDVLAGLAGIESDERRLLASIERQVRLLREGPFLVGRDLVAEASRTRDTVRAQSLLNEAVAEFRTARHNAETGVEQAVVEAHLGFAHFLLGHRDESRHQLTQAHERLSGEAARLMSESSDVQVLDSRNKAVWAAVYYPVGLVVAVKKVKKLRRAESARLALVELQPVLTALSQAVQAVGGTALPSYEMAVHEGAWTLEPVIPALG